LLIEIQGAKDTTNTVGKILACNLGCRKEHEYGDGRYTESHSASIYFQMQNFLIDVPWYETEVSIFSQVLGDDLRVRGCPLGGRIGRRASRELVLNARRSTGGLVAASANRHAREDVPETMALFVGAICHATHLFCGGKGRDGNGRASPIGGYTVASSKAAWFHGFSLAFGHDSPGGILENGSRCERFGVSPGIRAPRSGRLSRAGDVSGGVV
jgi:hypothetical protein